MQPINTSVASILGVYTFLMSLWVFIPLESNWREFVGLNDFDTQGYSEYIYGAVGMIVGAVMVHGCYRGTFRALTRGAIFGFYFWMFTMGASFYVYWQGGTWITALLMAFYCGYIYINLKVNRKIYVAEALRDYDKA